jgi:bifunctional pyridoxal-dependent enzyme with beta-cystathionase and maltose regulon repressor activities
MELTTAFEHATSWLEDLRTHADENVSIIRECIGDAGS